MTPCSVAVEYQRFGGPCCTTQRHNPKDLDPKLVN